MAIGIDGNGTITGLSVGGLPDATIVDADIATLSSSKLTGALPALDGSSLTGVAPTKATIDALGIAASSITGSLPAIDGSSLTNMAAGGKVLQVVEANDTTHTSASTTSGTWTDTVVTATITPASTSNKIFVSYRLAVHFVDSAGSGGYGLRCKRAVSGGSTTDNVPALSTWSSGNVHTVFYMETNTGGDFNMMSTVTGLDSPVASTAVTYTVGIAPFSVSTTLEAGGQYSGRWSMVLMEIEG